MTDDPGTTQTPQAGVAQAVGDLSDQTRRLVRQEITIAQREIRDKAAEGAPALALAAAAGVLGLAAGASAYRLTLRLLERRLPPDVAALAAAFGYGAAAGGAAALAVARIRRLPPLLPETASRASQAMAGAADEAGAPPQS